VSRQFRIAKAAFRQIDAADSWWRENRPASPDLFLQELQLALHRIQRAPTVFAPLQDPRFVGLRRLLLSGSRYHIYWVVDDAHIDVLAVWHTSRGHDPFTPGDTSSSEDDLA